MTYIEAEKRVQELTTLLEKYNYEYYVLNQSTVSDQEFDRLMEELKKLEEEFQEQGYKQYFFPCGKR